MTVAPKPQARPQTVAPATKKDEKQPFVRKPHLTNRPFRTEAIQQLRADLDRMAGRDKRAAQIANVVNPKRNRNS